MKISSSELMNEV